MAKSFISLLQYLVILKHSLHFDYRFSRVTQLHIYLAVGIDCELHLLDVTVVKLFFLAGTHLRTCCAIRVLKHILNVKLHILIERCLHLVEYRFNLDIVAVTCAEVIDIAVFLPAVNKRIFDIGAALGVLHHNKKICLGKLGDKSPVI